MAKWKISHDVVLDQHLVVYTKFLDHNVFQVKIMKTNDDGVDVIWQNYVETGLASKDEVVTKAFKKAEKLLVNVLVKDC